MSPEPLNLSIDVADPEAIIPAGLVTAGARFILIALGFDYVSEDRGQLLFVQQYDSRREETVRNMRMTLKRDATIDDVREAIYTAGSNAKGEEVSKVWNALKIAIKGPAPLGQLGPLPSQYGPNILASTMPAKS